ncbi:fructose-6-phosphate aldolase [uncultured Salinisphaera sp.]|uniref:fructose-6-phosphate aldolase n=1 Tax=uncultured Salinisphaera sp. TaxID=359372 RepID=UPI0032B28725|tara:strand:+ start:8698 stop:9354 length:657 start_codon:yes stop_codon:yes gene_type:complete
MKFFVDTADVDEIRELADMGLLDGVTTNPSLINKAGRDFIETITEICKVVDGPVSAEVAATDYDTMMKEGEKLATIADNVCVKVPLTPAGLKVGKNLVAGGQQINVTLCFSAAQALLAAKIGATYISPFIGRLDDIGQEGMTLIREIGDIYAGYPEIDTQVLAASIRGPQHVVQAALSGADVVTVPPKVLHQMFNHPLTDKGLEQFVADWQSSGQSIL